MLLLLWFIVFSCNFFNFDLSIELLQYSTFSDLSPCLSSEGLVYWDGELCTLLYLNRMKIIMIFLFGLCFDFFFGSTQPISHCFLQLSLCRFCLLDVTVEFGEGSLGDTAG